MTERGRGQCGRRPSLYGQKGNFRLLFCLYKLKEWLFLGHRNEGISVESFSFSYFFFIFFFMIKHFVVPPF